MDDRYEVEVVVCHACAARQRKSNAMHSQDAEIVGDYYIVTPEVADG